MSRPHLKDSSILVVEDHPLIVMDISMAFESAGAHLTTTNTVKHAKLLGGARWPVRRHPPSCSIGRRERQPMHTARRARHPVPHVQRIPNIGWRVQERAT